MVVKICYKLKAWLNCCSYLFINLFHFLRNLKSNQLWYRLLVIDTVKMTKC